MSIRRQAPVNHRLLMGLLMFVMRVCLAAHFAGKNAETLLGPNGHRLKRFFEWTHLEPLLTWCICSRRVRVVGMGGQSVVIDRAGYVEKYNYTLAGTDERVLRSTLEAFKLDQAWLEENLGELVQPTTFGIAPLPLRWPFNRLKTIYSRQQRLTTIVDLFSPEATRFITAGNRTLRQQIALLVNGTNAWLNNDKWLDLIGPNNIVITTDFKEPCLRILDTGPYASEYIRDKNPTLGRTYEEVFRERLKTIQSYSGIPALLIVAVSMCLINLTHGAIPNPHHILAFLDIVEDSLS